MNNKYPSVIQTKGLARGIEIWSPLVHLLQPATARQYLLNVYKAAAKSTKLRVRTIANSVRIPG
jgi:hypothetical protein